MTCVICSKPLNHKESLCSIDDALAALDQIAPNVPLVAFGQTALWDEPFKALIAERTRRPVWVGVHDLDYFSRLREPLEGGEWRIVPRNDGVHKDVWIAAGELSALFGAEAGPSRQALAEVGVRLNHLIPNDEPQRTAAIDAMTESWGWRGIVHNSPSPKVVADLAASEVAPVLRELLQWGISQTSDVMGAPEGRESVAASAREWLSIIDEFTHNRPAATLSDLYRHLYAHSYANILGGVPDHVQITSTREFLRFNRRTAKRKRFGFAKNFLGGKLARISRVAYDEAVNDSGINSLAEAGEHATPFDIYVPGRGRGTLHIAPEFVRVDLPSPVTISLSKPVRSVTVLAELLEENFGSDICLVGKAMVLPAMLCAEAVMILTETGSSYIPQTERMLAAMAKEGVAIDLYPILRLRLNPWDALRGCHVQFKLPIHLAHAFERDTLCGGEFAKNWRRVVEERRKMLLRLGEMLSPSEFIAYMGHEEHAAWFERLERSAKANAVLLDVQRKVDELRHESIELRLKEDALQDDLGDIETRRGEFNRKTLRPLKRQLDALGNDAAPEDRKGLEERHHAAAAEGEAQLIALESMRDERRKLIADRKAIGRKIRAIERSGDAQSARRIQREVLEHGMRARLQLAQHSLRTVEGLIHGDARPSAWWVDAVDPSGRWLAHIRCGARCWIEPLVPEKV
jgi:hypothetical protein